MITYNKDEIRKSLTGGNIFELLYDFGGDPEYTEFGIISSTICHNLPHEGSRKLYYYNNTGLFQCYTGCGSFDPFELVIKVIKIQNNIDLDLNDAVRYIAQKFGIFIEGEESDLIYKSDEWTVLNKYDKIKSIIPPRPKEELIAINPWILSKFNYNIKIEPWLNDGISQEVINNNLIGFYPLTNVITIPHYNKDGGLVGIRGRALMELDAKNNGKYRPVSAGGIQFKHSLNANLYNLNNSKNNIKKAKKGLIFEGEKSCLLYQTLFGMENDLSTACCGSNISDTHIQLLKNAGAEEIIIAFDRQFQKIGDDEYKKLISNFTKINDKYGKIVKISFIFDKNLITSYKASPIDEGAEKFLQLFKERVGL